MGSAQLLILIRGGIALILLWSIGAQARFTGFGADIDRYIRDSAQRYRISESFMRGLVKMEDGWYGKISPTNATGVGQFTRGTWNWLAGTPEGRMLGMRAVTSANKGTYRDPRRDNRINTLAVGLLASWHVNQFRLRGIPLTDENLYLAHNLGIDGLHRAMTGRATGEDIRNMRLNGMTRSMGVKEFLAYQQGRYFKHKQEANFGRSSGDVTAGATLARNKNLKWIEPITQRTNTDPKMKWIEPVITTADTVKPRVGMK